MYKVKLFKLAVQKSLLSLLKERNQSLESIKKK